MQFLRIGNKNVLRGGTDGGISVVARVGHPRYRSWPTGAGGPCHIAFGVEKCDTLGGLRNRAVPGEELPVNTQIEQAKMRHHWARVFVRKALAGYVLDFSEGKFKSHA